MKNTLTTMMAGAATVAAVTAGSAFMAAPAEAVTIKNGDVLSLTGNATLSSPDFEEVYNLNFTEAVTSFFQGDPFVPNDLVAIASVNGVSHGDTFGPIDSFITGIQLTDGPDVNFNLRRATFETTSNGALLASIRGHFVNINNDKLGVGNLSFQITPMGGQDSVLPGLGGTKQGTFSATLTAVPTPGAVLPGLIGMGTAVFRKKKQEDGADVAVEPAEANA